MQNFSVAMSVYKNDNPTDFALAIYSIYNQTCQPDEIVLVIDGPIPDTLRHKIDTIKNEISILRVVQFLENRGHAAARQGGLENARNELVAIMDSDDIAEPTRFERQLQILEENPELTVCGSIIHEFIGTPDHIVGTRAVPETDPEIKQYLKSRCPMNLQTVMYRKSKVMEVGGFIDWFCEEDYYLWVRLSLANHLFYNIQEPLVFVRVGKEMYQRRGGMRYFRSEAKLQKYMLEKDIITLPKYMYNVMIRFIVQVAMPNRLRGWVFQTFARNK